MLLTIIVPCFNISGKSAELFELFRNIRETDVEVVLVNDGSTDCTRQIIEELKENSQGAQVVTVHQINRGAGGARNNGLALARGGYIWLVDADDEIFPEALRFLRDRVERSQGFDLSTSIILRAAV